MLLLELFDEPATFKTVRGEHGQLVLRSRLSDSTYLDMVFAQMGKDRWKFSFKRSVAKPGFMNKVRTTVGMQPTLTGSSYGKTKQGNQTEVFSTVVAALKQFYSQYDPLQLIFTADKGDTGEDTSRASLYASMVRRMLPRQQYDIKIDDAGGFDQFTITKKELRDAS